MKKQEYYKIVRRVGKKLYSWQYFTLPKNLRTQYYLHRPTIAKVGGLLVFDNLKKAQDYCPSDFELYRCTCREEVTLPPYRDSLPLISKFQGRVPCWNRKKWSQLRAATIWLSANFDLWPKATKAFKVVTLRERVR